MNLPSLPSQTRSSLFHAYSVWLFTRSDLKTIVIPGTMFGILNRIALSSKVQNTLIVYWPELVFQVPAVAFWLWINLLPFNIDNQRQEEAILEDRYNKPWRTMPSGRMSPAEAKALMLGLYPLAFCVSVWVGGIKQCLTLMLLGFSYNELKLADRSWASRNAVNALGFCCFTWGALEVALSTPSRFIPTETNRMTAWLGIIAAVVFSTVQIQDMTDQEGDRLRKRKTMPLSLGDGATRWLTAVLVMAWSTFCPRFWDLGVESCLFIEGLGIFVAYRTLAYRNVMADKETFILWNMWMMALYSFPVLAIVT